MGDSLSAHYDRLEEEAWKKREKELIALCEHWKKTPGDLDRFLSSMSDGIEYVSDNAVGDRHLHGVIDGLKDSFQTFTAAPRKKSGKK